MNRIMIAAMLILAGCSGATDIRNVVDPVDVSVPVVERAQAPKELFRPKLAATSIPRWVAPSDPSASTCISAAGEPLLKSLLLRDESLLDGWESYGR